MYLLLSKQGFKSFFKKCHRTEWPWLFSSKLHLALGVVKWRLFVYKRSPLSSATHVFSGLPSFILQQETRLMGASERNSWKLNAMCPHEFLRAHSSYCASNVCDRNINRSADVLSWVLNLPARQRVITCQRHEEQHTVTPGYTFSYNGISQWMARGLEQSQNMVSTSCHCRNMDLHSRFSYT